MVLMKAAEFAKSGDKSKVFNLNDVADEARAIIAAAQKEKEKIITQAKKQAQEIKQQSQHQGHRQGYDQGLAEGKEKGYEQAYQQAQEQFARDSENLLNTLNSSLGSFEQNKHELLWKAQQGTVALAVAIADKITRQIAQINPDVALENVKMALDLISRTTNVIIKVSEKDLDHLEKMAGKNDVIFGNFNSVRFEPNLEIAPGGCCLSTEQGQVDARLDIQIQRIADELLMQNDPNEKKVDNKENTGRNESLSPSAPAETSIENQNQKTKNKISSNSKNLATE